MDYFNATYDEVLQHVLSKSSLTIYKARRYHEDKGHEYIVKMIDTARIEANIIRKEQVIAKLKEKLRESKAILNQPTT
jgi:hypothetical protein